MRADAARIKRSTIFKGEEFERFDREGALAELLEVYMVPATCVEYKLGRHEICLVEACCLENIRNKRRHNFDCGKGLKRGHSNKSDPSYPIHY